jgi:hypothetical protein
MSYYWGMHFYWWFFWIFLWVVFLFLHDANEACNLPSNAIADAAAATAICRRGDHK